MQEELERVKQALVVVSEMSIWIESFEGIEDPALRWEAIARSMSAYAEQALSPSAAKEGD